MAIEIVKSEPSPKVLRFVDCWNCGVSLKYVPNDIKEDYSSDYTGGRDYYNYIPCPVCKAQIHVNKYK